MRIAIIRSPAYEEIPPGELFPEGWYRFEIDTVFQSKPYRIVDQTPPKECHGRPSEVSCHEGCRRSGQ